MENIDYASFCRPCFGEKVSGDVAVIDRIDNMIFLAMIDVLGHGQEAHNLANRIVQFLQNTRKYDVVSVLLQLHKEIKGSRGAVAGFGILDIETGDLRYAGVGNTVIRVFGRNPISLYSGEGIIGSNIRQPKEQHLNITKEDIVLLYSDGVQDRFELSDYPQLSYERAATISRNIVGKFGNVYDDTTCIVLRCDK